MPHRLRAVSAPQRSAAPRRLEMREAPHTRCSTCPVRNLALFEPIKHDLLDYAQQFRATQYVVEPRQVLYREGDKISESYTLFAGWVMLYKELPDGRKTVLRFSLPGDFLGYQADAEGAINHSAMALTEGVLCAFPRASLVDLFSARPELSRRMAHIQSRDMAYCYQHMTSVGQKSARERIAALFLELFYRMRERGACRHSHDMDFPLTQEDIGGYVGLTTVHVNRVVGQLRDEGLVACGHRRLSILDEPRLAEVAGFAQDAQRILALL